MTKLAKVLKAFSIGGNFCTECQKRVTTEGYTEEERDEWKLCRICKDCAKRFIEALEK